MEKVNAMLTYGAFDNRKDFAAIASYAVIKPTQGGDAMNAEVYVDFLWKQFSELPMWAFEKAVMAACHKLKFRPQSCEISECLPIEYRRLQAWQANIFGALRIQRERGDAAQSHSHLESDMDKDLQARLHMLSPTNRKQWHDLMAKDDFVAAAALIAENTARKLAA